MQTIIIVAAGLITFILLIKSQDTRRNLLYLGLFSIGVGYRSIHLGAQTYLVPLEIIFLLLFVTMVPTELLRREKLKVKIPKMLLLMAIWAAIIAFVSWITGIAYWDDILAWTFPLVIGVPAFWVIRRLIVNTDQLATAIKIILIVSIVMSLLALLEYFNLLPGVLNNSSFLTPDGFVRAAFNFWGYGTGAIISSWGMIIAYHEIINSKNSRQLRFFYFCTLVLTGTAVYFSGQRSSWLGVAFAIILLGIQGRTWGLGGIIFLFVSSSILPAVFWQRLFTVTNYVEYGTISDSSTNQRLMRWTWGWNTMLNNAVFGGGYGHWLVHNVFLEIGSTIGVVAAIAFLVFFIQLMWRITKTALFGLTPQSRHYGWLFLALAMTWLMQLNVETVFQTPPMAVAFWPYMALAWYLPEYFPPKTSVDQQHSPFRRSFNDHCFYTDI